MKYFIHALLFQFTFSTIFINRKFNKEERKLLKMENTLKLFKKHSIWNNTPKNLFTENFPHETRVVISNKIKNQPQFNRKTTDSTNVPEQANNNDSLDASKQQIQQNENNLEQTTGVETTENKQITDSSQVNSKNENNQKEISNILTTPHGIQYFNYPNKDLTELLTESLQVQNSENIQPIIVINQGKNPNSEWNPDTKAEYYIAKQKTYEEQSVEINYNDIQTILQILENIEKIYDEFYQDLPVHPQHQKIKVKGYQEFYDYIQRLQLFTRKIIMNSPALMTDLNFYENKISLFKKGEENMMHFYNLETNYKRLKQQTVNSEENQQRWSTITYLVNEYNSLIDSLQEQSQSLYRFNKYLAENIKELKRKTEQKQNSNTQNTLESLDSLFSLSIKLIELKDSLQSTVSSCKSFIKSFKQYYEKTQETLDEMQNSVNVKLETESHIKAGVGLTFFTSLIVLFN